MKKIMLAALFSSALSATVVFSVPANAATVSVVDGNAALISTAPVLQVQYRRCGFWYRECRIRWGFGPRFRRCLAIRGCL